MSSFGQCPYRWFVHYIEGGREEDTFYASYGSFMHEILAGYYNGRLKKERLSETFLVGFRDRVRGMRPDAKVVENYVREGAAYLRSPLEPGGEILGVEREIRFEIEGIPFVGFIDLLTRDENGIVVTDHKSRAMKPRSKKGTTKNDGEIDEMLKQLYLYSAAVKKEYGEFPKRLRFNCFRSGTVIDEPFREDAYGSAVGWAADSVRQIIDENEFEPKPDWFRCRYLCGYRDYCEEWED